MHELLLLNDDELAIAVLEFFSRFTAIDSETPLRLAKLPGNLIKLLVVFLSGRHNGIFNFYLFYLFMLY